MSHGYFPEGFLKFVPRGRGFEYRLGLPQLRRWGAADDPILLQESYEKIHLKND